MLMKIQVVWTLIAACLPFGSSQGPLGLSLPSIMRVDRNWVALPTYPIGTVVARVQIDRNGERKVTFGLETTGPPAPFAIDKRTGVVTVNDTLIDKENQSYSLWVTAHDGGLPQRTEVVATITDNTGQSHGLPIPPPFQLPGPHQPFSPPYNFPFPTKAKPPATAKPTPPPQGVKVTDYFELTTEIDDANTLSPPKTPEDVPEVVVDNAHSTEAKNPNVTNEMTPNAAGTNEVTLTIVLLVAVCGGVFVVIVIVVYVWKRKNAQKAQSKKDDMNKDQSGIVLQDAVLNPWERPRACSNRYESWDNSHLQLSEETSISKVEPQDQWEFPRHRLRIFNIVGEGAFGQVWRAQATDIDGKKGELTVAVKTLKENASEKEKTDLLQELAVMKSLGTHLNVVRLVGCCTDKVIIAEELEPTFVIMEFVGLGKLQQFLRDSRAERHYGNTHGGSRSLTSRDLTHFAYQVARGMDFLSSKGIIHRDLAARNVLITEDRTCKVADFGFARDVAGTHVYERKSDGRLPIRWMAPESLYDDIFSVKSDIWSFGVLLWEIVTLGSTPYPGLSAGDVMRKVRDGHRLEKPEHCRRELYNIMYYCWEAEPSGRPDFAECVTLLERLLCTETDYIELERFPDHSYYNVQHLDGEKL